MAKSRRGCFWLRTRLAETMQTLPKRDSLHRADPAIDAGTKYVHNYLYGNLCRPTLSKDVNCVLYYTNYTYAIYTRANPKSEEFLIKEIFKLQMQDLIGFQIWQPAYCLSACLVSASMSTLGLFESPRVSRAWRSSFVRVLERMGRNGAGEPERDVRNCETYC